jgi:hypothetical protein
MSSDQEPVERLYVIMTDSPHQHSRQKLARKKPSCDKQSGFWTSNSPDDVWQMSHSTASDILSKLGHNNPRILRSDKAMRIVENQKEASLRAAAEWEARKSKKNEPVKVSPEPEDTDTPEP